MCVNYENVSFIQIFDFQLPSLLQSIAIHLLLIKKTTLQIVTTYQPMRKTTNLQVSFFYQLLDYIFWWSSLDAIVWQVTLIHSGKKHAPNYVNDENVKSGKCEACGNNLDENNVKLRKDKRFCSAICAKRFVLFHFYCEFPLVTASIDILLFFCYYFSKRKENKDRDGNDKQWMESDEMKKDDIEMAKKNGEDKNLANAALDDSLPKINPVKWTVSYFLDYDVLFIESSQFAS